LRENTKSKRLVRIKLVNAFEFRGATIRGKKIRCVCRNFRLHKQEMHERKMWLELDDAICVIDVPYGIEKFK